MQRYQVGEKVSMRSQCELKLIRTGSENAIYSGPDLPDEPTTQIAAKTIRIRAIRVPTSVCIIPSPVWKAI